MALALQSNLSRRGGGHTRGFESNCASESEAKVIVHLHYYRHNNEPAVRALAQQAFRTLQENTFSTKSDLCSGTGEGT